MQTVQKRRLRAVKVDLHGQFDPCRADCIGLDDVLFDIRVQFRKGFRLRVIILTLQNKDIRHGILFLPREKVKYQTENERAEHGKRNRASAEHNSDDNRPEQGRNIKRLLDRRAETDDGQCAHYTHDIGGYGQ